MLFEVDCSEVLVTLPNFTPKKFTRMLFIYSLHALELIEILKIIINLEGKNVSFN